MRAPPRNVAYTPTTRLGLRITILLLPVDNGGHEDDFQEGL